MIPVFLNMDNNFATISDQETVAPTGSAFARHSLKPLTITMCVLGLISSLLLVVTIFARCRRWTNLPITSTLYLHICAVNILECLNILFLIPIWNSTAGFSPNNKLEFFFDIVDDVFSISRPAFLLSIYLFRLQFIIRPSSLFNGDEVQRHWLKPLIWCVWIGAVVISVIDRECFNKSFCGEKVNYAMFLSEILLLVLQVLIIVVSVAMVAYLSVMYRRFSYNHSEVTPLLDGGNAALLENIALTIRIVCSTLLVDLLCFSFAMVMNVETIIYELNPNARLSLLIRLYHWLGSELFVELFFLLPGATYAILISWVLILVQASMRQALWGVVKRVVMRFCGRDNEE
eukprot:sb/3466334/